MAGQFRNACDLAMCCLEGGVKNKLSSPENFMTGCQNGTLNDFGMKQ